MKARPFKWVVYDTEDDSEELLASGRSGFDKRVTQIAAVDNKGNSHYSRGNIPAFLKWLKGFDGWIYAHNQQYDLSNLFRERLEDVTMLFIGSRLLRASWKGLRFRDSLNMFPMTLKKVGESIGLKKLKRNSSDRDYVERDVEIVALALKRLLRLAREYDLEQLPGTIGGLAMKVWKGSFGANTFYDDQLSRAALYGGRVELFRRKASNVTVLDINSLYPSVMRKPFPESAERLRNLDCEGIAEATVKVSDCFVAPLPYRTAEGRIQFPVGKFRGQWPVCELRNATENGAKILKLHSVIGSRKLVQPYKDFVEHFYRKRMESQNDADRLFFKLLMNNLYGQLATKGTLTMFRKVDGVPIIQDLKVPPPEHTNLIHAAMVTGYGRVELFRHLKKYESDLCYCDTDSVIFRGRWTERESGALGEMKLVQKARSFRAEGPKLYMLDEKWKAKGVPQSVAADFAREGEATFSLPFKVRESITSGNLRRAGVWRKTGKRRRETVETKTFKSGVFYPRKPLT